MATKSTGPRLSSFKKRQDSMSPGDMKVAQRTGTNDSMGMNNGLRAPMPKPRRKLFTQAYWRGTTKHPDYLFGNPDSVRHNIENY